LRIGNEDDRYWLGQRPAVSPKKLLDFIPLDGYICEFSVDFIHEQDDFHRRISRRGPTLYSLKRQDLLRLFVVQERKVLLFEARDRPSGLIGHDHIERHVAIRATQRDRSGNQRNTEYIDPTAATGTHAIHLTRAAA
jgi:hypothetical protein